MIASTITQLDKPPLTRYDLPSNRKIVGHSSSLADHDTVPNRFSRSQYVPAPLRPRKNTLRQVSAATHSPVVGGDAGRLTSAVCSSRSSSAPWACDYVNYSDKTWEDFDRYDHDKRAPQKPCLAAGRPNGDHWKGVVEYKDLTLDISHLYPDSGAMFQNDPRYRSSRNSPSQQSHHHHAQATQDSGIYASRPPMFSNALPQNVEKAPIIKREQVPHANQVVATFDARPPWKGASGRTTQIEPIREGQGPVAPLRLPQRPIIKQQTRVAGPHPQSYRSFDPSVDARPTMCESGSIHEPSNNSSNNSSSSCNNRLRFDGMVSSSGRAQTAHSDSRHAPSTWEQAAKNGRDPSNYHHIVDHRLLENKRKDVSDGWTETKSSPATTADLIKRGQQLSQEPIEPFPTTKLFTSSLPSSRQRSNTSGAAANERVVFPLRNQQEPHHLLPPQTTSLSPTTAQRQRQLFPPRSSSLSAAVNGNVALATPSRGQPSKATSETIVATAQVAGDLACRVLTNTLPEVSERTQQWTEDNAAPLPQADRTAAVKVAAPKLPSSSWVQPPSRFSVTTYAPSLTDDSPEVPYVDAFDAPLPPLSVPVDITKQQVNNSADSVNLRVRSRDSSPIAGLRDWKSLNPPAQPSSTLPSTPLSSASPGSREEHPAVIEPPPLENHPYYRNNPMHLPLAPLREEPYSPHTDISDMPLLAAGAARMAASNSASAPGRWASKTPGLPANPRSMKRSGSGSSASTKQQARTSTPPTLDAGATTAGRDDSWDELLEQWETVRKEDVTPSLQGSRTASSETRPGEWELLERDKLPTPMTPPSSYSQSQKQHSRLESVGNTHKDLPTLPSALYDQSPAAGQLDDKDSSDTQPASSAAAVPIKMAPADRIALLNAQIATLAQRKATLTDALRRLTDLIPVRDVSTMPSSTGVSSTMGGRHPFTNSGGPGGIQAAAAAVLLKRQQDKVRIEALRAEIADVQREEYELGLKLHRAYKRLDRDDSLNGSFWVSRAGAR